jgi:hypothetical protein
MQQPNCKQSLNQEKKKKNPKKKNNASAVKAREYNFLSFAKIFF